MSALTRSNLTVTNIGAGPAAASKATITDEQINTVTVDIGALAAGASTTVTYPCAGLLRIRTATADSAGTVTESDETNNTLSATFGAGCPPT